MWDPLTWASLDPKTVTLMAHKHIRCSTSASTTKRGRWDTESAWQIVRHGRKRVSVPQLSHNYHLQSVQPDREQGDPRPRHTTTKEACCSGDVGKSLDVTTPGQEPLDRIDTSPSRSESEDDWESVIDTVTVSMEERASLT